MTILQRKLQELGEEAYNRVTLFDEKEVLLKALPYIIRQLGIEVIEVVAVEDAQEGLGYSQIIIESAEPNGPGVVFYNLV